ncbi:H(+)-transporting ATPase [Coprinopsis sp. MPI-PUGE-AT-0042]|nr:H(+)-transporting ATPase [Coprinopsis sp. MPI-PUGE-AT-0042]
MSYKINTSPLRSEDVILLAAYASCTENQDAIDTCLVGALGDPAKACAGNTLLDFKPFKPIDKNTKIACHEDSTSKLKHVSKGMASVIIELCTCNKTNKQENHLEADVKEYTTCGLHALAVACEDLNSDDFEAEGSGFELIGLLAIFDPPCEDTKQTIENALTLGVKVKMVTGDQLTIAKETGCHLGLSDHVYPAKVLKDGPAPSSKHRSLDEMIMDADSFAGVFPKHKYKIVKRVQALGHLCTMTGDGANDAPRPVLCQRQYHR